MTPRKLKHLRRILASAWIKERHRLVKAVSGRTRYQILTILGGHKEGYTVSEIAYVLQVSISRVSHQMKILKNHRLVSSSSGGKYVTYRLAKRCPPAIRALCPPL
jgi:DNA-binding transcriptional ArsR family regulator